MDTFSCKIDGVCIVHHDRSQAQTYTDSIDYPSLKKQLGAEGKIMKILEELARKTASSYGYNVTTAIWVDLSWSDDGCSLYVRVEQTPGPGDTSDALGDRVEITAKACGAKLQEALRLLSTSRDLAELGKPHEISADPSRQQDPSVVYHQNQDVVRVARKLVKLTMKDNLAIQIDEGDTVTLEPPHRGGAYVVGNTRNMIDTVEITGLNKPHDGSVVLMRQCGKKRKLYRVHYTRDQYPALYAAMAIHEDQRYEVELSPIIDLLENNAKPGAYRLIRLVLVMRGLALGEEQAV